MTKSIRIDDDPHKKLKILCANKGLTIKEYIEAFIEVQYNKEENKK